MISMSSLHDFVSLPQRSGFGGGLLTGWRCSDDKDRKEKKEKKDKDKYKEGGKEHKDKEYKDKDKKCLSLLYYHYSNPLTTFQQRQKR